MRAWRANNAERIRAYNAAHRTPRAGGDYARGIDREKLVALYRSGMGVKSCLDAMGVSRNKVSSATKHLKSIGVFEEGRRPPKGPKPKPAETLISELCETISSELKNTLAAVKRNARLLDDEVTGRSFQMRSYYSNLEESRAKSRANARKHYDRIKKDPILWEKRKGAHRVYLRAYNQRRRKDPEAKAKDRACTKRWRKNNMDRVRAYHRKMRKQPRQRAVHNLRKRLRNLCRKGQAVSVRRAEFIGCSPLELVRHIERQFTRGMSWENYGKWHVDHIRPCASFDLTDQEQVKQCFHFSNLQPLWGADNMAKSDKWDGQLAIAV